MHSRNGVFITFEGADGVGKTTHVKFYASVLKSLGKDVVLVREPGGTRIGEQVRDILLDARNIELTHESELMLYLAARSQVIAEVVRPALETGKIVLCDRFFDSTLAYQGYGRGLSTEFIKQANEFVVGSCEPDLTILFNITDAQRAERLNVRGEADRIESEGEKFEKRVSSGFLEIAKDEKQRICVIDTSESKRITAERVIEAAWHLVPIDFNDVRVQSKLDQLDLCKSSSSIAEGL